MLKESDHTISLLLLNMPFIIFTEEFSQYYFHSFSATEK